MDIFSSLKFLFEGIEVESVKVRPQGKKTCFIFPIKSKKEISYFLKSFDLEKDQIQAIEERFSGKEKIIIPEGDIYFFKPNKDTFPSSSDLPFSPYAFLRDGFGEFFRELLSKDYKSFYLDLKSLSEKEAKGLLVGLSLSWYQFKEVFYKRKNKIKILVKSNIKHNKIKRFIRLGVATNLSRHMVNLPPNLLTPERFVKILKFIFEKEKRFSLEIYDEKRLKKEKMGLLLGVGQGSCHPPYLVRLKYRHQKKGRPFSFVGKGICFDTGGLDLKPPRFMRWMKKDMGGAATLLGLAYFFKESRPSKNYDFYFALAENSVSKNAFRPSDILRSHEGVFVEVEDTDAEGRLVLAEALELAVRNDSSFLVDVATLTGSIKASLGEKIAGVFSTDKRLLGRLEKSSEFSGEPIWHMPIAPHYKHKIKTPFADFRNCGEGYGDALVATLFLNQFVKKTPWAHFDIYGWKDGAEGCYAEKGGSGQLVQTLAFFCGD